jgi:hypothetical protein
VMLRISGSFMLGGVRSNERTFHSMNAS